MKDKSKKSELRDTGSERALLGTLLRGGKQAFYEADGIIASSDFSMPINRAIYLCLKKLCEDPTCEKIDGEAIKLKAKALGMTDHFNDKKDLEYLELLPSCSFEQSNIPMFAMQIKKYSIVRDLCDRYESANNYLHNITGNESISEILRKAEGTVMDYINGAEKGDGLITLTENIDDIIEKLIESEPVDQIGIPTGYPVWDDAIGGGPRPGTVTVIGARPKTGKSFDALNKARNIAKRGIPTLYLDTELTKTYQQARLVCIESGCPLSLYETAKFNQDKELVQRVRDAGKIVKGMPIQYESVAGMTHTEVLAIARRWIAKYVGFKEDGKANDCVIIYDYLKLTSGAGLAAHSPEYILLGLMLTELHTFAVRYGIPIIGYVQLNRDGIDAEDTSIIAGSDRILWLCSSLSVFKNKDENDISLGCGWEHGNKKMLILETRQGSGLEVENDYINLKASLRPHTGKMESCGLITEGFLYSKVNTGIKANVVRNPKAENSSREDRRDSGTSQSIDQ